MSVVEFGHLNVSYETDLVIINESKVETSCQQTSSPITLPSN